MKWLKSLGAALSSRPKASVQSSGGGMAMSADDPRFLEQIRMALNGSPSVDVMRNGAVNRAVRLHCECIAMLPLQLMHRDASKGKATDHPLYQVLTVRPNNWQTPYEFKRLMMVSMLKRGAAYAQIVRSRGRIIQLQPLNKFNVEPKQNADWSISYHLTSENGIRSVLPQSEILAVRDLDMVHGICGQSKIDQARDALILAATVKKAAQNIFENNLQAGGAVSTDQKLSEEARNFLRESMRGYQGAENAGKWMVLEQGLKPVVFNSSLGDNNQVENLNLATEDVARIFGTPRPLLMMDETSWGSGIEALGLFFISYGLAPQFVNWEEAVTRDCLTDREAEDFQPKFNDGALLRGSKKDQADFYSRALGSGGGKAWMTQDEVRLLENLPQSGGTAADLAPLKTGATNVPAQSA